MKNVGERETTYTPEALETARKDEERRMVLEGREIWKAQKEEALRHKQREQCELRKMLANYWPWGKPGGGAPCASALRKRNVPLEPSKQPAPFILQSWRSELLPQNWRSRSVMDRLHDERPYDSLDRSIYQPYGHYGSTERSPPNDHGERGGGRGGGGGYEKELQVYRLTGGGVELAPLLTARGDVARRKIRGKMHDCHDIQREKTKYDCCASIDATRPGYTIDSWRASNIGNQDYINELCVQMQQKQERVREERRRERENSRRHFDTWRRLWGRPGHGAPIDQARRRNNLNDILYRTSIPSTLDYLPATTSPPGFVY